MKSQTKVDYSFQANLDRRFVLPSVVTVVGTGGFGAWVAIFAARAGVKRLVLINPSNDSNTGDDEDIGGRELAVGPFNDEDFGKAKVDVLKDAITAARPGVSVVTHKLAFDPTMHQELLEGVVFAGVSNAGIYLAVFEASRRAGLRCFGGSYSGVDVGVYSEAPIGIGISSQPAWVGSTALSALLAINAAFVAPINFVGDPTSIGSVRTFPENEHDI